MWSGTMRRVAKRLWAAAASPFATRRRGRTLAPCVLVYHGFYRERRPGIVNHDGKYLHVDSFRRQLAYLKTHFAIVPLVRIVSWLEGKDELPPGAVAITIDDGYESVHRLALPVLRELAVPASVFVTTGFLDRTSRMDVDQLSWAVEQTAMLRARDRVRALRSMLAELRPLAVSARQALFAEQINRLKVDLANFPANEEPYAPMTWDQARDLARAGIDLGPHGATHVPLSRCDDAMLDAEIVGAHDRLAQQLGNRSEIFCYPFGRTGDVDSRVAARVRTAGLRAGVTVAGRRVLRADDRFTLPRFGGGSDLATFAEFRASLAGLDLGTIGRGWAVCLPGAV